MKLTHLENGETIIEELSNEEKVAQDNQNHENAWKLLRSTRDGLLAASDWTVLTDTPTPTAAWKTYRQALRDLPANTTDPFNPVWPTPPT